MRILIAGGTGFIGSHLVNYLQTKGHQISILGRNANKIKRLFITNVNAFTWNQLDLSVIQQFDVIINLAGENIAEKKWNAQRKQEILASRVHPTKLLADLCTLLGEGAPRLLNASAIGVYGLQTNCKDTLPPALDENSIIDFNNAPEFSSFVARQWEKATYRAYDADCKVVNMRFGVVLNPDGGALKKFLLPYKLGLGGIIASGNQPFCWVALTDLMSAIEFILEHPLLSGPVNITAPHCATQKQFAKALAKALHRPMLFRTPAWLLKLIFGEMAEELLLKGQHVIPTKLLNMGFEFQYPTIEDYCQTLS